MRRVLLVVLALAVAAPLAANEGMWMLHQLGQLDQAKLRAMGLELTPQQLWDMKTDSGLASAVVSLGGCSASFVSPEGLVATNHHCAFGAIQINSTPEKDYVTNGFVAATKAEELEAKGSRVYVNQGYEEITKQMTAVLKGDMKPEQRAKALEQREKELIAACEKDGLRCRVASMFGGLEYWMFRTLELRDVRLVYAPPRSVGEYGGEIDNWEWPRHSGDFSFLRAYVGPDGKPADFSPANVPYKPTRWLKVSKAPLAEGDFTMIIGFPGRTYRYRIATSIAEDTDYSYPNRIALYKDIIDILERESKRGKDVEIKLSSSLKGYYNGYKNNQGMVEGLRKSDLAGRKRAAEAELKAWIAADPKRAASYGDVLPKMEALVAERQAMRDHDLILGQFSGGRGTLIASALGIERWSAERAKADIDREPGYQDRDERTRRQGIERMQRNLDVQTDRALLTYLLKRAAALPTGQRIAAVDAALAATGKGGDEAIAAFVDSLYAGTRMADKDVRLKYFDMKYDDLLKQGDAIIDFAARLRPELNAMDNLADRYEGEMVVLAPRYMEALMAWKNAPIYPDANSTVRFTYGTIKGYAPRDGQVNTPFTTLRGVVDKHTGEEPFDAPDALLAAAKIGPFPAYADPKVGDVVACFLTTNDITGGNSGSPIMNGRGELIGLAFDGNYESMTSDYQFSDAMSRTINVDSRYVLWVMDYVSKAHNLLREMGFEPQAK